MAAERAWKTHQSRSPRCEAACHYTRGERTRSTLVRIPDTSRIEAIGQHFECAEVRYFGALTWTMPLLRRVLGRTRAGRVSDAVDQVINVKRSAFKFVLVAQGLRSQPPATP